MCANIYANAQEKTMAVTDQQLIDYLENALKNDVVNAKTTQQFYQRTHEYWWGHIIDYTQHPEKYRQALSLYYQNQRKYKRNDSIKMDRFEDQIETFRQFDNRNTWAKNAVLFVGSSSIVHWETAMSFPGLQVINRGFGGASIPEIIHYYDDVIKKYSPSVIVIYCDIDIERGKSPAVAVNAYKELVNKVRKDFSQTQILLLSMKPALVDDFLGKDVRRNKIEANRILREYCENEKYLHYADITKTMLKSDGSVRTDIFLPDGMHLNQSGYKLWDPVIWSKIMCIVK